MGITSITRDYGPDPSIVRIVTTDNYATITAAGYLFAQKPYIEGVNLGEFQWADDDLILVNYAGNNFSAFFNRDPDTDTLIPSGAGQAILNYAEVPITAAQFNGMYAAPVLLLPAPGANNLYVIERAVLAMTFKSADYAAGGVVALQYEATVHGAGVPATATVTAASFFAGVSTSFMLQGALAAAPFSTTVNQGIYLSNQTGAFTTGDSTFVAHIWYRQILTA